LAQLRIFGIEDASLMFLAVSDHQRSTHTNYLIELLKSVSTCCAETVKYDSTLSPPSTHRGWPAISSEPLPVSRPRILVKREPPSSLFLRPRQRGCHALSKAAPRLPARPDITRLCNISLPGSLQSAACRLDILRPYPVPVPGRDR
jgi:hypothetical protein